MTKPELGELVVQLQGKDLPQAWSERVDKVSVVSSLHAPDVATIVFRDSDTTVTEGKDGAFVDDATKLMTLGKELQVIAVVDKIQAPVFDGVIVEIAPQFVDQKRRLVIRAMDRLHYLTRGDHTQAFLNSTDEEIIRELIKGFPLTLKAESPDLKIKHDYVLMANRTRLSFLRERLARLGLMLYAEGKTLHCRPTRGEGKVDLTWRHHLMEFCPRLSSFGQSSESVYRATSVDGDKALVASKTKADSKPAENQSQVAQDTKSEQVAQDAFKLTDTEIDLFPLTDDAAYAEAIAKANRQKAVEQLIEATGVAQGNPLITAGSQLHIWQVGERFSGQYIPTMVEHIYNNSNRSSQKGYRTEFSVTGGRDPSLLSLILTTIGQANGTGDEAVGPAPGLMLGTVTDIRDDKNLGRVKVRLDAFSDEADSYWARVVNIGGGAQRGTMILPEVNDRVLVAFEFNDRDMIRPYVLGGVWGQTRQPPYKNSEVTNNSGKVIKRVFKTRSGHEMVYVDSGGSGDPQIVIRTASKHEIVLVDGSKPYIRIKDILGNEVKMDREGVFVDSKISVNIKATANINLEAKGGVSLQGASVSIKGQAFVDINGKIVKIN